MNVLAKRFCAILIFTVVSAAFSEDIDWKKGKLGHLSTYIGTYNIMAIYDDPYVNRVLKDRLGKEYQHLIRNLQVRGPIDMVGGHLVVSGNEPHNAYNEAAILTVSPYDGEVNVALFSQGKITLYSQRDKYEYLPADLQVWIFLINKEDSNIYSTPPANLVWKK